MAKTGPQPAKGSTSNPILHKVGIQLASITFSVMYFWADARTQLSPDEKPSTIYLMLYNFLWARRMTPLDRLLEWHGKWKLLDKVVTCKKCGASQPETERGNTFPHIPKCMSVSANNPWRELDGIQLAFKKGSES